MKKSSDRVHRSRAQLFTILILAAAVGYGYYEKATQVLPQAAIHFLEDVRLPQTGEKVLVFAPHPDDETIGAGGYIRESVDRGAVVRIILVTDGNKHNLEAKRYQEFRNAARILGVKPRDLIFLNHPDGQLKGCDKPSSTVSSRERLIHSLPLSSSTLILRITIQTTRSWGR